MLNQKLIKNLKGDMSFVQMSDFIKHQTGEYISPSSLHKYVLGKRNPSDKMLRLIARAFNIDKSQFVLNNFETFEENMDRLIDTHGIGKLLEYLYKKFKKEQ